MGLRMETDISPRVEESQLLAREVIHIRNNTPALKSEHFESTRELSDEDKVLDSGWSLVVGISSLLAQTILGGYSFTGGIFYTVFTKEFPDTSTIAISWLCTLPLTLLFVGTSIGSVLINTIGCRQCAIIGSIMASIGLSLCFFASNFYMLFAFYGLLAGFGNGIHYNGFLTSVSRYFKKYRTLVLSISCIGPSLGMSIYSFLIPYLTGIFGWKGCLLILGGMSFNICACAGVIFPINTTKSETPTKRKRFNIHLLRRKYFTFFCIHCFFCNLANSMILLHLPSFILSLNFGVAIFSLSLTVYGLSNLSGKLLCGLFVHFTNANVIVVYTVALIVSGVLMALTPVFPVLGWVLPLVGLLGFAYGVTGGHSYAVTLELSGQDDFADGVGLSLMFKSAGTLVAGPLAGILYRNLGNFKTTFYISGCLMVFGCILLIPSCVAQLRTPRSPIQDEYGIKVQSKHEEAEMKPLQTAILDN